MCERAYFVCAYNDGPISLNGSKQSKKYICSYIFLNVSIQMENIWCICSSKSSAYIEVVQVQLLKEIAEKYTYSLFWDIQSNWLALLFQFNCLRFFLLSCFLFIGSILAIIFFHTLVYLSICFYFWFCDVLSLFYIFMKVHQIIGLSFL